MAQNIFTQSAAVADRFAREIAGILAGGTTRLRRLSGNPLGGQLSRTCHYHSEDCHTLTPWKRRFSCLKVSTAAANRQHLNTSLTSWRTTAFRSSGWTSISYSAASFGTSPPLFTRASRTLATASWPVGAA